MSQLGLRIGKKFARLTTNAVVRRPRLWRLFRRPLERQFDSLAPRWDSIVSPTHLAAFELGLEAVSPAPARVLDVGTGTGGAAFVIAGRFPEAEVVGVDISAQMVAEGRRKTPPELAGRVRLEQGDASALPFPDGAFDLVTLANAIPFFDELARVVAPGGSVLFGFSGGSGTPIYVPSERLRAELGRRGFAELEEFSSGRSTAVLARRQKAG